MHYAYARVSAHDQNLCRQMEAFRRFGIDEKHIFADKKSGKDFDRTAFRRLVKRLKPGDLLVIASIDRLGRKYESIIEAWSHITGQIGADILVLDMPVLDTRIKDDSLVGQFISDIVLQILSFVAENERANIRARQAEGIALAKSRGVRFGRPRREYDDTFRETARAYNARTLSLREALERTGLSRASFYYHLRMLKQRE